jgi:hypothetical protein
MATAPNADQQQASSNSNEAEATAGGSPSEFTPEQLKALIREAIREDMQALRGDIQALKRSMEFAEADAAMAKQAWFSTVGTGPYRTTQPNAPVRQATVRSLHGHGGNPSIRVRATPDYH